jgi:hypothetical protein
VEVDRFNLKVIVFDQSSGPPPAPAPPPWGCEARVGARGVTLAVAGFTSTFRPSTMAPCSCCLAQAFSQAVPRVMKPKLLEPFSLKMTSASMTRP